MCGQIEWSGELCAGDWSERGREAVGEFTKKAISTRLVFDLTLDLFLS